KDLASPMPAPFPKSFSDEHAETLVFIHFLASSIFRELPSLSAKIRYHPAADSILKTVWAKARMGSNPTPCGK
ncbi:MAG: hypothetical protein J6Q17_08915, partial [Clostridia bacterium]|nr:hypothetical protein [Clostridia bacterium]